VATDQHEQRHTGTNRRLTRVRFVQRWSLELSTQIDQTRAHMQNEAPADHSAPNTGVEPLQLTHCTLTGVDESTDLDAMAWLSTLFPIVEWALLLSPTRQRETGRYPRYSFILEAVNTSPSHMRLAIHLCGNAVGYALSGERCAEQHLLAKLAERGGRVQLNFSQARSPLDFDQMGRLLARFPTITFIIQDNRANAGVWRSVASLGHSNFGVLFDSSGGRGIESSVWPAALPVPCGYAGGLGPGNLSSELGRIAKAATGQPVWIDMESKLRRTDADGNDWLDLDACREVLQTVDASPFVARGGADKRGQVGATEEHRQMEEPDIDVSGPISWSARSSPYNPDGRYRIAAPHGQRFEFPTENLWPADLRAMASHLERVRSTQPPRVDAIIEAPAVADCLLRAGQAVDATRRELQSANAVASPIEHLLLLNAIGHAEQLASELLTLRQAILAA